MTFLQKNEVAI